MSTEPVNPYEVAATQSGYVSQHVPDERFAKWLAAMISGYFLLSTLSLPLVNRIWFGALAPLTLIQLPKALAKALIHKYLLICYQSAGFSHGSHSPDYLATHAWALGAATVSLGLISIVPVAWLTPPSRRRRLVLVVIICVAIDTLATLAFDSYSHLKLYNGTF